MSIDIFVTCSPNHFFVAGFDNSIAAGSNPKLIVNIESFKFYNYFADKLIPIVTHEFTHYLESLYNPAQQQRFAPNEYNDGKYLGFYRDVITAINNHPKFRIDFGNFSSLNDKGIDQIARQHTLQFIKSKEFATIQSQYGITVDSIVLGKILKMVQSSYVEDLNTYMTTGGDIFGTNPKDPKTKKNKEESRKIYYNSDTEISGHLNQIISELQFDLKVKYIIIDLIKGKKTISNELPNILELSPTFRDIKSELTEKNLLIIYKEVAKYLLENSQKKSNDDLADKIGFKLTSQEQLTLRYLEKLYSENPEKLNEFIKDKVWADKNMNPLMYMRYKLNMFNELSKLRSQIEKFNTTAE